MYADTHGQKISNTIHKAAVRFGRVYLYRSNSNRWYVMRGKQMIFGHGGERTLCWACEDDAQNDDGAHAVAAIYRA